VGVDFVFGDGFNLMSGFSIGAGLLFLIMASSRTASIHTSGTIVAWLLYLAAMTMQSLGMGA
jgi:hypothetical protein